MGDTRNSRPRHGDARRSWSDAFVDYMYAMVEDPAYEGMPATTDSEGKVDWIIPSYRPRGSKNWDGNARRREWWEAKADELGIPRVGKWISRVAKTIHPTGEKPCQTCGRVLSIRYVYPYRRVVDALNHAMPTDAPLVWEDYLTIFEVVDHMALTIGPEATVEAFRRSLPALRDVGRVDLEDLKDVIDERLVQAEARGYVSPGAMANPPDRLDGFHTYNLCCRSKEDKGRSRENLRSYGIDRRAFEHWSAGDWNAASALMTHTTRGLCMNPECALAGVVQPLTADHVGPLSLGFAHIPVFQLLCRACNSAKNNRMSTTDVQWLLGLEEQRWEVASWQVAPLWDALKLEIHDNETALRLSKVMRTQQHLYLSALSAIHLGGLPDSLLVLLSPEYAADTTEFVELDRETLTYEGIRKVPRHPTYALSQGSRMVRVAFSALEDYAEKARRNVRLGELDLTEVSKAARGLDDAVYDSLAYTDDYRAVLAHALEEPDLDRRDALLRALFDEFGYRPPRPDQRVLDRLGDYMYACAQSLVEVFRRGAVDSLPDELAEPI